MKGPQLAATVWLANLVVMAGGAFLGYSYYTQVKDDRDQVYDKVAAPRTDENRISWQNSDANANSGNHAVWRDTLLSPMNRPPAVTISPGSGTLKAPARLAGRGGIGHPNTYNWSIEGNAPEGVSLSTRSGPATQLRFDKSTPQDAQVTVRVANPKSSESATATFTLAFDENITPEVSDNELREELEAWVNKQFTLLRLWYGVPAISSARVRSEEAKSLLLLKVGTKFPEKYAESRVENERALAKHDIEVKAIEPDHVVMHAPSQRDGYTDRYYDVKLKMDPSVLEPPDINKFSSRNQDGASSSTTSRTTEKPPKPAGDQARDSNDDTDDSGGVDQDSTYDEETDTWTIRRNDYKDIKVDDLARYAKVVSDRNGNAVGIQISEKMPKDNVVLGRGARRGDIIKSINGQSVKSMSDVRRIVGSQRKSGVEKYVVVIERDGVPRTKTFNVPVKKD